MKANYAEFTALPNAWVFAKWSGGKVIKPEQRFKWSGKNAPPAIGADVHVYMNGFGDVTVTGYFVEYGWLGFLADVKNPPAWWLKQNGGRKVTAHFFGIDLEPANGGLKNG